MGFESHVHRELQRAASGLVQGEDYWFFDGLRVVSYDVAERLKDALDDSGDFGPTTIVKVKHKDGENSRYSMYGEYLITFEPHPSMI